MATAAGASGATRPFTVIEPGPLGFLWSDAVGEGATFLCVVVGVFVLGALGVEEPVELLLVEGGTLLRPVSDGNDIVGAVLAIASLGGVSAVKGLAMSRWTITAWACRVVIPLTRVIGRVAVILVAMMGALGILHVAVLVDDDHHVGDGLGVALEHLPP